jgi:ankyrin repeat protein
LLIDGGADLNPVSEAFDNPLAMALHIEWYDIADSMLSKGAQVNPDDSSCVTAGNIAAVKSLDMTKKPFAEGYNYGYRHFSSALQAAAFHHNRDVVELLLNRNADPGITGSPYGSASVVG